MIAVAGFQRHRRRPPAGPARLSVANSSVVSSSVGQSSRSERRSGVKADRSRPAPPETAAPATRWEEARAWNSGVEGGPAAPSRGRGSGRGCGRELAGCMARPPRGLARISESRKAAVLAAARQRPLTFRPTGRNSTESAFGCQALRRRYASFFLTGPGPVPRPQPQKPARPRSCGARCPRAVAAPPPSGKVGQAGVPPDKSPNCNM